MASSGIFHTRKVSCEMTQKRSVITHISMYLYLITVYNMKLMAFSINVNAKNYGTEHRGMLSVIC